MLADGRFPSGGHAHSGGLEAAAAAGRVTDVRGLEAFLQGRVATSGVIAASFAAAACAGACTGPRLAELGAGFEARTPAPALRAASRKLGRQLLRTARAARPDPRLDALAVSWPQGAHQPLVLGVTARVFALAPHAAAAAALHDAAAGPATAAVRLLGLDPFEVQAVLAGLTPRLDELAREAGDRAGEPVADLPAPGSPLLDISAEHHTTWEVRLFAS
ncbi:urease accessory protein UreF [Streptomyces sp. NBC_01754]|nr:urease accessory UreF family protein [Streptomyces sp. NBC_01754]WSC96736.1 urease accessory protein UreF [Streptomyces sp. NBC_01754]